MSELKNKVALISGGGRDIGAEVSKKLSSLGAKVCFSYFDDDAKGQQTLKAIKESGGEATMVKGDLTKTKDIDTLVNSCIDSYGKKIDILVNDFNIFPGTDSERIANILTQIVSFDKQGGKKISVFEDTIKIIIEF